VQAEQAPKDAIVAVPAIVCFVGVLNTLQAEDLGSVAREAMITKTSTLSDTVAG
jgi:hypothetical protein